MKCTVNINDISWIYYYDWQHSIYLKNKYIQILNIKLCVGKNF